jgi:hypothetical protein
MMTSVDELKIRSERLLPSLGPIYEIDDRNRRELIGTSVFFKHESQHFVLSARHVLIRERPLQVGGETTIISLVGRFFHSGMACSGSTEYDLAFFPLSDDQAAALRGAAFLTVDDLEPDSPASGVGYYAAGFLVRDFEVHRANQDVVVKGTAIMASAADGDKYRTMDTREDTHLLLAFDRFETFAAPGRMEPTPRLHGMSGSGVWHFDRRSPDHDKLAAILIEHHQQDHKVIVATRVGEFFRSLTAYLSGELA